MEIAGSKNVARRTTKKAASKRRKDGGGGDSLKVVYISSPMKVKTSASKFRSIVQHLTGKDSDIQRYLEDDAVNNKLGGGDDYYQFGDEEAGVLTSPASSDDRGTATTTTTPSYGSGEESFLGAIDEVFTSEMEEIFCSNLFCDGGDGVDVLGSHADLLRVD